MVWENNLEYLGTGGLKSMSAWDADRLYSHGWESDPDCVKWWKRGEPEEVSTFQGAVEACEDWLSSDD